MRRLIAMAVLLLLLAAVPAAAQVPDLPPVLPPPGGGGSPSPQPGPPAAPRLPAAVPGGEADEFRLNAQRSNYTTDDTLIPPLVPRWARRFGPLRPIAYALAADDKAFLAFQSANSVVALSLRSGRTVWRRDFGGNGYLQLSWDRGDLYAVTDTGTVRALDPASGRTRWERQLTAEAGRPLSGAPVSANGLLFLTGDRPIALNGVDGSTRWTGEAGEGGSLLLEGDRTIFSYGAVAARRMLDGHLLWRTSTPDGQADLLGGGGRLYRRLGGRIFDSSTGAVAGDFGQPGAAAIAPGIAIAEAGMDGVLQARALPAGPTRWTFPRSRRTCSASEACSEPVVAGHDVYVIHSHRLYALDLESGRVLWSRATGTTSGKGPLVAGAGVLLDIQSNVLVAYSSAFDPARGRIDIAPYDNPIEYGRSTRLYGALGRGLRDGTRRPVTLQADGFRFGRFRAAAKGTTATDGGFSFRVAPRRNTRFRATAAGGRSGAGAIFVLPRFRDRFSRGGGRQANRIRVRVTAAGPPSVRLAGRRVHLYLAGSRRRVSVHLAGGRLRRAGRGRARATLHFGALRHVRRGDFFFYCVRGLSRAGLGPPDGIDRRCGARRI